MYDTNSVYRNLVTFLDMVDVHGTVDEHIALELLDEIITSGDTAGHDEKYGMMVAVVSSTLSGELDDDARRELDKTREFLAD